MNKKYSELAELFRSEKTDEEILDFLLNYHKNDIADMMAGMTEEERKRLYHCWERRRSQRSSNTLRNPVSISGNCLWRVLRE